MLLQQRDIEEVLAIGHLAAKCRTLGELQREVLVRLERTFKTGTCYFHPRHGGAWRADFDDFAERGLDGDFKGLYLRHFYKSDPFARHVRDVEGSLGWSVVRADRMVEYDAFTRGEFYSGFLRRFSIHHIMVMSLASAGRQIGRVVLTRPREQANFSALDLTKAELIVPSLVAGLQGTGAARPAARHHELARGRMRQCGLTRREIEVAEQIALGLRNHEIADRLCISVNTVQSHIASIFRKTGVGNRTGLLHRLSHLH